LTVPLYLNNGVLLVRGGGLAANAACCCESPCEYRYICHETVYSTYQASYNTELDCETSTIDNIPAQPADVVRVSGWNCEAGLGIAACAADAAALPQWPGQWCLEDSALPTENPDTMYPRQQYYFRTRVVDSCDECVSSLSYTGGDNCPVGVEATGCANFSAYTPPQSTQMQACADALGIDLCAPPCSGPCESMGDCGPGCDCVNGQCVGLCVEPPNEIWNDCTDCPGLVPNCNTFCIPAGTGPPNIPGYTPCGVWVQFSDAASDCMPCGDFNPFP
jgi:hypothetical protein